jgi:hypothetical protein
VYCLIARQSPFPPLTRRFGFGPSWASSWQASSQWSSSCLQIAPSWLVRQTVLTHIRADATIPVVTLILSLMTPDFVLQASDRMVTYLETGEAKESNRNKMVVLSNRMIFGFSGLAELEGKNTDEWIAKVLMDTSARSTSDGVNLLASRATEVIRKLSHYHPKHRRLAIVGTGYVKRDEDDRFYPILCRISNFHDSGIDSLPEAVDSLSVRFKIYKPPQPNWGWMELGAKLNSHEQEWLSKRLKRCSYKGTGPTPAVRLFIETIRHIAKRNGRVGRNVLIGMIPRLAAEQKTLVLLNPHSRAGMVIGDATDKTRESFHKSLQAAMNTPMNFLYVPAGSSMAEQYGPILVDSSKGMVSGFTSLPPT